VRCAMAPGTHVARRAAGLRRWRKLRWTWRAAWTVLARLERGALT
jgi:hypothetical protein